MFPEQGDHLRSLDGRVRRIEPPPLQEVVHVRSRILGAAWPEQRTGAVDEGVPGEHQVVSGRQQAEGEVVVLQAPPDERFVEGADRLDGLPGHEEAGVRQAHPSVPLGRVGPVEGGGQGGQLLRRAVLRGHALACDGVAGRTHRTHPWIAGQRRAQDRQVAGRDGDLVVEQQVGVVSRPGDPPVESGRRTERTVAGVEGHSRVAGQEFRDLGGGVQVEGDQFEGSRLGVGLDGRHTRPGQVGRATGQQDDRGGAPHRRRRLCTSHVSRARPRGPPG